MTTLIAKIKSALSNMVVIAAGFVLTGLAFAMLGALALFGLVAIGVAAIALPFVARPENADIST